MGGSKLNEKSTTPVIVAQTKSVVAQPEPTRELIPWSAWDFESPAPDINDAKVSLEYCCSKSTNAKMLWTPKRARRVRIVLDYVADCDSGTMVLVKEYDDVSYFPHIDFFRAFSERCPISVEQEQTLEFSIKASGGLGCCGTTTMKEVVIEDEELGGVGWSKEQCADLYSDYLYLLQGGDPNETVPALIGSLAPI